ncbi:MAG TPA: nitroreductase family protein [Candidatus Limiplasma sp.]|nr:nitroreductase family protein [Candidatus Limiplasma sp.]
MNTMEAILARASYRGLYLKEPVPRADLETILQAGLSAPSGCNRQTTSLIGVDDPELLRRLFGVLGHCVGDTAPAMVCVLAKRLIAYRDRSFWVQDYSAAIQNMLLAAVELGYASCWVEGYVTDADQLGRQMADILGVPEDTELVCYLPVGRAAEPVKRAVK